MCLCSSARLTVDLQKRATNVSLILAILVPTPHHGRRYLMEQTPQVSGETNLSSLLLSTLFTKFKLWNPRR